MIVKGQKINDRYEIIRVIGEGGMANVYLAYDTILDRNVAVKVHSGEKGNQNYLHPEFLKALITAVQAVEIGRASALKQLKEKWEKLKDPFVKILKFHLKLKIHNGVIWRFFRL